MFKAKDFDASNVTLGKCEPIGVGSFSQRVLYYDGPLRVQLPPMIVSRGLYEKRGRFYVNVLVPHESAVYRFAHRFNTAVRGTSPIVRTTRDDTGTYHHLRLRVSLPPLIAGTDGLHHAKVGHYIRAIASIDHVGRYGEWDVHLQQIERT